MRFEDNGPGFPEPLLGQLFEPYITSKHKGSGLGLAIVKKIVEEHSGMLWAENCKDGGACITLRLPVQNRRTADAAGEYYDDDNQSADTTL
jgi:nitrogen fixation/metabolism regulation signal transduction histidine kinase